MFELEPNNCRWSLPVSVSMEDRMRGGDHGQADVKGELDSAQVHAVDVAQGIHVVLLNSSAVPHLLNRSWPLLAELCPGN